MTRINFRPFQSVVLCLVIFGVFIHCQRRESGAYAEIQDTILSDSVQYHPVRVDQRGAILPWYSKDLGQSYDTVLSLVWHFWKHMETDSNGLKYYMNHQVWKPEHDIRGLGGDQINMALSSWALYYAYTGDSSIVANMQYMADYYLQHSLSPSEAAWPNVPYPYNTDLHSGVYDGDMRDGKGITQPDKAGNFGQELLTLYKITNRQTYRDAAIRIADCLASHTADGDSVNAPLPFRVNALTGETGRLLNNNMSGEAVAMAGYTSNWSGTLILFEELVSLNAPNSALYKKAYQQILGWMVRYPLKTNRWGPFFEDVPGWSDTQVNAITFAMFILNHRDQFPNWQKDVKGIIDWTHTELGNHEYKKFGVEVMNEQTVYRVPGNSHTSRQSSVELMYAALSGDTTYTANAIRALNWATYTVDHDGKNRYIRDDIWLTDGYGDYIRHFLRSMAAKPDLAPSSKNRLLYSSSVVCSVAYTQSTVQFNTFSPAENVVVRLTSRPSRVSSGGMKLRENCENGWNWQPLRTGGVLVLTNLTHKDVKIQL